MSHDSPVTKSFKVSVVMPCFNHGEFLTEAVASVTHIGCEDIELIVVDDGSTDERTCQEVDKLVAGGIKVIRQENKGPAAARNAGILASHGEYIFPLDADDRVRPGWINQGIRILDSDPQVGVVYGDAQCFGQRSDRWVVGPFVPDQLLRGNYIHVSALYRRSVWQQNRGYDDTTLLRGIEDWDFWLGALEREWKFAYLPEVLFDYRISEGSMRTRVVGIEKQIEEFVALKHGPLYRNAWLQLTSQQESLKWAFGNLCRSLGGWSAREFVKRQALRAFKWIRMQMKATQ
jgi:glycosyltransferase involved in cell wall biosynthesis